MVIDGNHISSPLLSRSVSPEGKSEGDRNGNTKSSRQGEGGMQDGSS